jgi:hypothetical protein
MIQRQITIEHAVPWLVSSVSSLYIIARARNLSLAEASDATLAHFLFHQSDVVLILCGCPALWHFARSRHTGREARHRTRARAIHQLRQVFTAMMLGTSLLARRASAGKTANIAALAQRLNKIAHDGAYTLEQLGDPYPLDRPYQYDSRLGGANGNSTSA